MRAAVASAILIVVSSGCRAGSTSEGASSSSSSPSSSAAAVGSAPGAAESAGVSKWSNAATDPVELVATPDRAVLITFQAKNGGYIFHRGDRTHRLPREWFGAGPPRRDLSISNDGSRLIVPETGGVVVYETEPGRLVGRFAGPQPNAQGKSSADGKYIVWSAPDAPCSMTEIASAKLQKKCP